MARLLGPSPFGHPFLHACFLSWLAVFVNEGNFIMEQFTMDLNILISGRNLALKLRVLDAVVQYGFNPSIVGKPRRALGNIFNYVSHIPAIPDQILLLQNLFGSVESADLTCHYYHLFPPRRPFPFFKLPAELRDMIIFPLVTCQSSTTVVSPTGKIITGLHPKILAVCRKMHRDYHDMLYSQLFSRIFSIQYTGTLSNILQHKRSLVKREMPLFGDSMYTQGIKFLSIILDLVHKTAFTELNRFPCLKSIAIIAVNLQPVFHHTANTDERLDVVAAHIIVLLGPHGRKGLPRISPADRKTRKVLENVIVTFTARYSMLLGSMLLPDGTQQKVLWRVETQFRIQFNQNNELALTFLKEVIVA